MFNNFIPISLYVTVEMVNYAQSLLVNSDASMYDPSVDTPARARTSNLNQDLGQVEYIFSDKTGTLTRNVMEFKQMSVAGRVFGVFQAESSSEDLTALDAMDAAIPAGMEYVPPPPLWRRLLGVCGLGGKPLSPNPTGGAAAPATSPDAPDGEVGGTAAAPGSGFADPVLMSALRYSTSKTPSLGIAEGWNAEDATNTPPSFSSNSAPLTKAELLAAEAFFLCMAVCHTVVPEVVKVGQPPVYQAESPDEGALSKAAREVGFEFVSRAANSIVVRRVNGSASSEHTFIIHGTHEFNSTRKRMAVVAQMPDGKYMLMAKGADNVMFDRALPDLGREVINSQLTAFASSGLRTLVLGQREMSPAEFARWQADYTAASVALTDRDGALARVAETYEKNLAILGATAIEDRLQAGVPGTIRDLGRAGIKIWVLTGDKVETAINIGYACKLLTPSMELIQVVDEDVHALQKQLAKLEARFEAVSPSPPPSTGGCCRRGPPPVPVSLKSFLPPGWIAPIAPAPRSDGSVPKIALVVTGPALSHMLGDPALEAALLRVGSACTSVIACRVSPQQKASIVEMVRKTVKPAPLTLAIGDGANDVGMIQCAEVGVGISGKEGLQAVNSSDFAIAQFRYLRRLLLVHGRWDYRRMSKVVLYSFYKNVVITLTLMYYNALAAFSGTSFYESFIYSSYNFVLGLPIIFVGIMDRDISAATALAHPAVYAQGRRNLDLNPTRMLLWIARAVVHSAVIFWLCYGVFAGQNPAQDNSHAQSTGVVDGMAGAGLTTFAAMIVAMTFKVGVETLSWTNYNIGMVVISMVGWVAFVFFYQTLCTISPAFCGVASVEFTRPTFYLSILLVLGAMALVEFVSAAVRLELYPSAVDIARELEVLPPVPWGDEVTASADSMRAMPLTPHTATQKAVAKRENFGSSAPVEVPDVGSGAGAAPAVDEVAVVKKKKQPRKVDVEVEEEEEQPPETLPAPKVRKTRAKVAPSSVQDSVI